MNINESISLSNQTWKSIPLNMRTSTLLQAEDPLIYLDPDDEGDALEDAVKVVRIVQLIIGVIGCVGNILCLLVLLRKSLRNYTNFLIMTQTIADLIASTFLILIVSLRLAGFGCRRRRIASERFGAFFCFFMYSHLPIFAFFAISTYNLTVISVERYLAVIKPMWYIAKFKRRRLYIITGIAWILAPLMQIILSLDVKYSDGVCITVGYYSSMYVGMAIFVWEYFLPVGVMLFSFASVAHKLRKLNRISVAWIRNHDHVHVDEFPDDSATTRSRKTRSEASDREANHVPTNQTRPLPRDAGAQVMSLSSPPSMQRSVINDHRLPGVMRPAIIRRKKTTKILFVIVLVYMVCWSPNQWAFFYHNLGGYFQIDGKVHLATIILATCNTCINPFILAFRYKVYQRGLLDLLRGSFRHRR